MNIEQAYIRTDEIHLVKTIIERRLNGDLQNFCLDIPQTIPDSYEEFLADNVKRKVAVSESINGWITILESKEVNDYAMLLEISKETDSEFFAIIQYDSVGAWGYVEGFAGKIAESYFSEEDDEIEDLVGKKMKEKKISVPIRLFREVVKERDNGWEILKRN